jgi:periplasmic protein TonB
MKNIVIAFFTLFSLTAFAGGGVAFSQAMADGVAPEANTEFNRDAKVTTRVPPRFSSSCLRKVSGEGEIIVEFDVTADGRTENPRVISASHKCLVAPALAAIKQWRYQLKLIDGVPQPRKGVRTTLQLRLER